MQRDVTLLTPTADQPTGMALCERYVNDQTALRRVARWVVVDDGREAAQLRMGQKHVRRERVDGESTTRSFCRNLIEAAKHAETEFVVMIEHDDCYHARHLEILLAHLTRPGALIAGDTLQRYYHVGDRLWRVFSNWGAAMCQTGFRRSALEHLVGAAEQCLEADWRGVDANLWNRVPRAGWRTFQAQQVVGIKGLPGLPGIGIGHRPESSGYEWESDPTGEVLREWCGEYAGNYEDIYRKAAS